MIVIYPGFDAFYYSFYIQGLIETFGESNIRFSSRGFPKMPTEYLSLIVTGDRELRLIIDAYDGQISAYQHPAIEWCDVLARVNLRTSVVSRQHLPKCLAIGPSFPIRVWPGGKSWATAIKNYRPSIQGGFASSREYFANFFRQYKYRHGVEGYAPGVSMDDYIFFSSTIWREEEAPRTNQFRAVFMKCCKSTKGITFEGGFTPLDHPRAKPYLDHIAPKRYPLNEWTEKIKRSAIAFNTPAVWQSHTFKLAEYLAMGKAIVSTPLVNDMPAPFVHGKHVHFVDGSEDSFRQAIGLITRDRAYRTHLEQNARSYFDTYLAPPQVIQRVFDFAKQVTGELSGNIVSR